MNVHILSTIKIKLLSVFDMSLIVLATLHKRKNAAINYLLYNVNV